ncbi:MAG TPA: ABC transporter permease subunit, partial [Actinomycetales bacterium]
MKQVVTDRADARPVPWSLGVPAAIGASFLLVPLVALLVRAPWRDLDRLLSDGAVADALRLSLLTATAATAVSLVLGVPLAFVLARSRARGVRLLRALVTVPLVLPPVVGGVALLLALGRQGIVGRPLEALTGITLPFSTAGVVVAETFVAMPFLVLTVEGAFRAADVGLDEAAATLGASRLTVFRRVTLPLVAPGIAAGAVWRCITRHVMNVSNSSTSSTTPARIGHSSMPLSPPPPRAPARSAGAIDRSTNLCSSLANHLRSSS